MDDARVLALDGAPAGTCVRADRQTKGRGREGREWVSPAGGLWFSVVVRPRADAAWGVLPLAAGCAVAEALSAEGVAARIKWPNDVRVDGRKIGGILVESRSPLFAVVGCGINVGVDASSLPAAVRETAGALRIPPDRVDAVFERAAEGIVHRAGRLDAEGPGPILAEWRSRNETLGTPIARDGVEGVAENVDETGALIVRLAGGKSARLLQAE